VKLVEPVRNSRDVIDPAWKKWVDLVTLGVAESRLSVWEDSVRIRESREVDAPLLHLATVRVVPGSASQFVRRLAGESGIPNVDRVDPLAVILAGIERDNSLLEALAGRLAIPADSVAVLSQLSALPVLLNAARQLDPGTSRTWQRGYCPVCGAWPALAEMRGIQRERRMRCGCCSSDWMLPVLRCTFCTEIEHDKLAFLQTEEGEQQVRVETCSTCRGYLKAFSTLSALPFTTLVTRDLATVAFDLAARDRGYSRPATTAWQVQVEIVQ
jgi:FdhE protein